MLKVALVAGGDLSSVPKDFDCYVGVDRGSLKILEAGHPLALAVGDFDSVSTDELTQIRQGASELVLAPKDKNDTDTELALLELFKRWPQASVSVFGSLGGRLDHLLANVFLPSHPDLAPHMSQISLVDEQNVMEYRPSGRHLIAPIQGMDYVAFMTSELADLTILGAKYPLTPDNFFKKRIYTSNEFMDDPIEVSLASGYLIIIHTRDRI